MTNTLNNVPRELLEDLRDAANESMNATTRQHQIDHFAGLIAKADALLSSQSPAGVDAGLVAVEWAKDAEEWGPALNEAGWLFLSELNEDPQKSALIFNNCKGPLRAAIMKYAEIVAANAKDSSHDQ